MFKFIFLFNASLINRFKYTPYLIRYYRTKHRKKVTIELNKPSLYDDKRSSPTKLLKSNLFTPESAGYRELSMLCFWIVNYGYADYSILTRYVECAIQNITKVKIKGIALIFHSVSKYLYDNDVSLVESHQIEDSETEFKNRQILISRCMQMILESSPILPNLFINAVPKDLGMISLSIMNIYKMFINECDIDYLNNLTPTSNKDGNTPTIGLSQNNNIKSIEQIVYKLLQKLAREIIPKLPFCEIDEFAAFAKAFSKINTDWSSHFMRELSHEISSLLSEKIEDLKMLKQNKFIGEDLIDQLNKLPKDLCTITCSMSKCNLNETKFWERSNILLNLLLEMEDKNFGIKQIDTTTLTLLCTSMCKYVNVKNIVQQMLHIASDGDNSAILVGFNTCVRILKDEYMANMFLSKLELNDIINTNTRLLSQFILNYSKTGSKDTLRVTNAIISLIDNDIDDDVLCSIFIARNALNLPSDKVLELSKRLSNKLTNIETNLLITMLMSTNELSTPSDAVNPVKSMHNQVVQVLCNRVDQIPLKSLVPLLISVLSNFGGNLSFIGRLCRRIDENIYDFDIRQIVRITDHLNSMGLNVNKLFSKNIMKIRDSGDLKQNNESTYTYSPELSSDNFVTPDCEHDFIDLVNSDSLDDGSSNKGIHSCLRFASKDDLEIERIAKTALRRVEPVNMLRVEDFQDEVANDTQETFELVKYPSNKIENKEFEKINVGESVQSRAFKAVSRSSNIEELKNEWSNIRQTVQ